MAMSTKSWFDHAFSSRQKAEQLLRPDLESGLLTPHDYQLAVSFLPGPVRYLPYIHTVLWGGLAGLAVYRFKPKVRFPTTIVGVSAASGYGIGIIHYIRQHKKFAHELQDREAFLLALDNVNRRIGNTVPLFPQLDRDKLLARIRQRRQENGEVLDPGIEIVSDIGDDTDSSAYVDSNPEGPDLEPSHSTGRFKSTWEAIREANARNAGRQSTWDELRQRHERQRAVGRGQARQSEPAEEIEDPRAKAQAEFDAILEAERKAAGRF
ncbi:hypothetical protein BN946_scf185007.g272 [Trametes cinnabarina]|uniref:Uncharacterized protein n=1 Tax=Pycnoporus cinnabarinus TaxID=5643 RepID=A0A060SFD1_PYCCI|nr:hypothetical protein BN946_scf185007.g272 [Trametes cinnabarina]